MNFLCLKYPIITRQISLHDSNELSKLFASTYAFRNWTHIKLRQLYATITYKSCAYLRQNVSVNVKPLIMDVTDSESRQSINWKLLLRRNVFQER